MSALVSPLAAKSPSAARFTGEANPRFAIHRTALGRGTASVRTASLLVRAMSNEPGEPALRIPGWESLSTWHSEQLYPIHGGGIVRMIVLRLCHLETIDSLAGAGARGHVLKTAERRMLGFASAGDLVAHLQDGAFAFATVEREQYGRDFASRLVDAMSRPSVFGKNLIHAPALAYAFSLDGPCGNVAFHLRRAMNSLASLDAGN